jgi:hypothetical protein
VNSVQRYTAEIGQTLADVGTQLALAVVDETEWVEAARRAIEELATGGMEFDADDVRRLAGEPPTPAVIGAVFREAHKRGLIRVSGYRTATRMQRHGSIVRIWRGER